MLFDYGLTCNWLRYRAPLHQHKLQGASYYWRHQHSLLHGESDRAPLVLACEGQYEITVDSSIFEGRQVEAVLNIPLPIESEAQSAVRLTDCFPPDLLTYVDSTRQMIPRYPWPKDIGEIRLSYQFQCNVKERRCQSVESESGRREETIAQSLRPMLSPSEYPKAKMMLKRIMAGSPRDAELLPERIYYWILDNISFYEPPSAEASIFDTGFGLAPDYTKLFVNLCRLAIIPARERCGALFDLRRGDNGHETIDVRTLGASPFQHTWGEFYVRGRGWKPVDFCAWLYGRRSLTSRNVLDGELRNKIRAGTKLHDAYYFGNLDPYRIHASTRVLESHLSFECSGGERLPAVKMPSVRHRLQVQAECVEGQSYKERTKACGLKTLPEPVLEQG
jgi:hypothetical protein